MAGRGKPKGLPKTGGRQKGSSNKLTNDVRNMIINALDKAGGESYLVEQATENPNAFLSLVGKVIPSEIKADIRSNSNIELSVKFK